MSAIDVFDKLDGFTLDDIDPLQRVLLITDGTVTEILEATFLERIQLVKVAERLVRAGAAHARLELDQGETVLERQILLRGSESKRNYAYAESYIAVDRLGPSFRDDLIKSEIPLGRLWLGYKLETFKELLEVRCRNATDLSQYFECSDTFQILVRTYRVSSGRKVVMMITEYFPARYGRSESEDPVRGLVLTDDSKG